MLQLDIRFYKLKQESVVMHATDQLLDFLSILVRKKLWFDAIKIMETNYAFEGLSSHQYLNALGFIYYNMRQYELAKFYYIEALKIQENYVVALQNLARVYEITKNAALVASTYKSILRYDPSNKIAHRYFHKPSY